MEKKPVYTKIDVGLPLQFIPRAVTYCFDPKGDGREIRWDSIRTDPAKPKVVVVGLTPECKLVLIRIFRFPVEDWTIEPAGGEVKDGESLEEAARREMLEETGYEASGPVEKITEGYLWNAKTNASFIAYLARGCRKVREPQCDPVEKYCGLEVVEMSPPDIIEEVARCNKAMDPVLSHCLVALIGHRLESYT